MTGTAGGRSRVRPHLLVPDGDIPADHRGRSRCTTCGLMAIQGDAHHPTAPPLPAAWPVPAALAEAGRERDAAILGEKPDDE